MADKIIDVLTTCFWDLRSQCESQVRTLIAEVRRQIDILLERSDRKDKR